MGAMDGTRVATLKVPGASLHYEVRGDGPLLLIIPGMPADAGLYTVLARRLAVGWTVVTYDPRGMSRSQLDGPAEDQLVEVHADDARRVLAAVGAGPAHVLTDSVSGLVGLQLAAAEPAMVRTLVAFEPPVTELLPDRERWRAFFDELHDTYRTEGLYPALHKFAEGAGLGGGEPPTPTRTPRPRPRWPASTRTWTGGSATWCARRSSAGSPDIPRLRAGPARVVVVVGAASAPHQVAWQASHALAGQLGVRPVTAPGDHDAVTRRPGEFAELLERVLGGS